MADRRKKEPDKRERGGEAAGGDEKRGRSVGLSEQRRGDRCDGTEKASAEPIHAGDAAEHVTGHVTLERALPEHTEAHEADSHEYPGDERTRQGGYQPVQE